MLAFPPSGATVIPKLGTIGKEYFGDMARGPMCGMLATKRAFEDLPVTQKPDYAELVSKAEQAVSSVKDPELRRIAFQKILDDLLSSPVASKPNVAKQAVQPKAKQKAVSRGGPQAYVQEMIEEGFFKKPKTLSQVKAELENRGHHIPITSLSGPLQKLCQKKELRRQRAKATDKDKQTWVYSEW